MFAALLKQRVQRHDKEAPERPEQQQQSKRRQQRLLDGEKDNRHANQYPGRHTARHRFQRHQLRRRAGPQYDPHRHHRVKVSRHGVAGNAQRHRDPQHQQKAQRHARPPEQAGAD